MLGRPLSRQRWRELSSDIRLVWIKSKTHSLNLGSDHVWWNPRDTNLERTTSGPARERMGYDSPEIELVYRLRSEVTNQIGLRDDENERCLGYDSPEMELVYRLRSEVTNQIGLRRERASRRRERASSEVTGTRDDGSRDLVLHQSGLVSAPV